MSHFVGLCFGENWDSYLEEYYEGLEVDPYIIYSKQSAIDEAIARHTSHYDYAVKQLKKSTLSKESYDYYNKIVNEGPSLSRSKAWEKAKGWGYEIDENDNLLATYNPNSKWDWYSVGGRWSGFLPLKKLDEEGKHLLTNEAYFNEIDWDYFFEYQFTPFCFVTEDGDWNEKGEMGWWGITTNEQPADDWDTQFKEYLKTVDPDCLVTVVDFHI